MKMYVKFRVGGLGEFLRNILYDARNSMRHRAVPPEWMIGEL